MDSKRICLSAFAALAAIVPLRAGGGDPRWRFGAQIGPAQPVGPISDVSSMGIGASLFAERRLSDRTAFSISLDRLDTSGTDHPVGHDAGGTATVTTLNVDARCTNAMWNYFFRLGTNDDGAYLALGAGLGLCEFGSRQGWQDKDIKASLPVSLGAGYNYGRNAGVEARYVRQGAKYEHSTGSWPGHPGATLFSATVQHLWVGFHFWF